MSHRHHRNPACPSAPQMIGNSSAMRSLRSMIQAVASKDCTVLIHGESGTGKELVAQHVHTQGPRASKPFIAVDCTTLPDPLFESQLFGHVKGAFTGADQSTLGFLRAADGGTVLLDEIGDLSPSLQAKLLRFLQDRTVTPLGSVQPIELNVRVLAATHQNLQKKVEQGDFRADLFYRLHVVNIKTPPLRQRGDDLVLLADYFLRRLSAQYADTGTKTLADETLNRLRGYHWPGNVRELSNAIEHVYVLSDNGRLTPDLLPSSIQPTSADHESALEPVVVPLETAERRLVAQALRVTGGHQANAARMLQVERRRLYRMVRRHGLESYVRSRKSGRTRSVE